MSNDELDDLVKIVVTDSGGVEHIFNEVPNEIEHFIELKDAMGNVVITTGTVGSEPDDFEYITTTIFTSPRKIEILQRLPKEEEESNA